MIALPVVPSVFFPGIEPGPIFRCPAHGGSKKVKKTGWPLPGQLKHEWAEKIGPLMDIEGNASPSFRKLRDVLRRLIGEQA